MTLFLSWFSFSDLPLYNTAVELMARAPQHYTQGIQQG